MERTIEQIALDATESNCWLYALANDGSVWVIQPGCREKEWKSAELPPLPQPESEADDD